MEDKTKENKNNKKLTYIRTFKSDASEYIKKKGLSAIDIAAAQTKKVLPYSIKGSERAGKYIKFVAIGALLVILLGGASFGFYYFYLQNKKETNLSYLPKPFFLADKVLAIKTNEVKDLLLFPVEKKELVYFPIIKEENGVKHPIGLREFFTLTGINPPLNFYYPIEDKFMLLVYNNGKEKNPILVLKVKSYEYSYVSMIKWENNNKLAVDLTNLFQINSDFQEGSFIDKEVRNIDTRALMVGDKENPILLYGFFNQKYLIITTSESAFKEIIKRLSSLQYLNE